jgi:hypothetical protein
MTQPKRQLLPFRISPEPPLVETFSSHDVKPRLVIVVLLITAGVIALADQGPQTAKIVSVQKHSEGRIVSWSGHSPIFDGYPFYDLTLKWNGKNYVVRYESMTGYYPKTWDVGKEIPVKHERGQFILSNGDETIPARVVNANDCVSTSSPPPGISITPQIPCD